jgi:hypothetical protein
MSKRTRKLFLTFVLSGIGVIANSSEARANFCPANYEPVCGENGVRYSNSCHADLAGTAPLAGGALIELFKPNVGETFFFWSTNDAFIDEAIAKANGLSPQQIPVFNNLTAGSFCSSPNTFQVDPEDMHFADMAMEICDGRASYIDENLDEWLQQVDRRCPWDGQIANVWDYRSPGCRVDDCGGQSSGACWCDEYCDIHGDCCENYDAICGG